MTRRTLVVLGAALLALSASASAASAPSSAAGARGRDARGAARAMAPVIGRVAVVERVSGRILAQRPASRTFATVQGTEAVPIGTVLDASHGVLRLLTALDTRGRLQSATLWGGSFKVSQSSTGNGMTRLLMRGSPPMCASGARARAISAKRRSVRGRRLWAQDDHGRYTTYGANSVATVLGTRWETLESCAGTITRVLKGRVDVLDLRRHETVTVGAGHSYLASARGTPATAGSPGAPTPAASATAEPLGSGTTSCSGPHSGSGTEVTVPAGAVCTLLAGTQVSGNVEVAEGGALIDRGAVIGGDLQADNAAGIRVGGGGSIGGNLQIHGLTGGPNSLCDTTVGGNVEVHDGAAGSPIDIGDLGACLGAPGLAVAGNLEVHHNAANLTVGGNTVKGHLEVNGNAGEVTVNGNATGGDIKLTDNHVGVGGTLLGNSAGGNCELQHNSPTIEGSANSAGPGRPNSCNADA